MDDKSIPTTHKFQLRLEGLHTGLTWSAEFEELLVSDAQATARSLALEAPVGCTITLWEFSENEDIPWARYERKPDTRINTYTKPEAVLLENVAISVEQIINEVVKKENEREDTHV